MSAWHAITCPAASPHEPAVVPATTRRHRLAVEWFARYFKRELGYDFMQYDARETPWDGRVVEPEPDQAAPYLLRAFGSDVYAGAGVAS